MKYYFLVILFSAIFLAADLNEDIPAEPDLVNKDEKSSNKKKLVWDQPEIDDVVVLTQENFVDFIVKNKFVMVNFFSTWCGFCESMAPKYT